MQRPRLLLLDEPLDSLDLPNQASMAALDRRHLRRRGRGDARRSRREPDPRLPRPGHLPGARRRGRGSARRGHHQRRRSRSSTTPPSRCCARATAGSSWSASPRHRPTTTPATRDTAPMTTLLLAFGQPSLTWNLGIGRGPAVRVPVHGRRVRGRHDRGRGRRAHGVVHGAAPPDLRRAHPGGRRVPWRSRRRAPRHQRRLRLLRLLPDRRAGDRRRPPRPPRRLQRGAGGHRHHAGVRTGVRLPVRHASTPAT